MNITLWHLVAIAAAVLLAVRVVLGLKAIGALKSLATQLRADKDGGRSVVAIGKLITQIATGGGQRSPRRTLRESDPDD